MNYEYIYDQIAFKRVYEMQSDGTKVKVIRRAVNFVKEVSDRIKIICDNPLRFRNLYKNSGKLLKKIPLFDCLFSG